jgi:hypothetical protein
MSLNDDVKPEIIDTTDGILDLLNDESDDTPLPEGDKPKEETIDIDEDIEIKDEEKEEEIKLDEEIKIEEDEVLIPVSRQEILKKYPNLYKDFPHLEKSAYRAREYDNIIGTIADAKEMVEKVNEFKKIESSVNDGNIAPILKNLAESNGAAFNKIVDDYLPQLHAVNPNAYFHVVGNIIKKTIVNMARSAKTDNDTDLHEAALILNKFVFRNNEFVPEQPFAPRQEVNADPEKQKLLKEKLEGLQEKFRNASEELSKSTGTLIKSTVASHIDPRNVMTDYVKRQAVRDTVENVEKTLNADTSFLRTMRRLWEKAEQEQFSKGSIEKIHKTYIAKAKTVLPDAIKKSRNDALKGLGKRIAESNTNSRRMQSGGAGVSKEGIKEEVKAPAKNMKTVDFFMQD